MRIPPATLGRFLPLLALALGTAATAARGDDPQAGATPGTATSPLASAIYAAARPRLLQVRTLLAANQRQTSLGSGFLVGADGLAVTNYHVVSQYALDPQAYRLEYRAVDGAHDSLKLLAIDVADDLAVVRLPAGGKPFFEIDGRAQEGELANGERLFSMGNPLDLGFAIVEGTYNGLVEHSYNERIHFSGALNPGMSGGPAVAEDGRVVGVNVSRSVGDELVSFLVPARFVGPLVERARAGAAPPPDGIKSEIGRQLTAWQEGFFRAFDGPGYRPVVLGPYQAPESGASSVVCWGQSNEGQVPKPRASVDTTTCSSDTHVFVSDTFSMGQVRFSHSFYRSVDLNQFQFANFVSQSIPMEWTGGRGSKWLTERRCRQDFMHRTAGDGPDLDIRWCAAAYREFAGLYDVYVTSVTQDRGSEALVSRLDLHGISFANATQLTRRFLDAVRWAK